MRCIFCSGDATESKSVEHIVPESFGNEHHLLPKGIVCDNCNNYFARKVELPFLEQECIRTLRFEVGLENKRGRIPQQRCKIGGVEGNVLKCVKNNEQEWHIQIPEGASEKVKSATMILMPATNDTQLLEKNKATSRFLAKVALESLARRMLDLGEGKDVDEVVNDKSLDTIRKFAREGNETSWDYNIRRIYGIHEKVKLSDGTEELVNFESDFLITEQLEWYFVIALYGMEYVINLGGSDIEGYKQWLNENENKSPLYHKDKEKIRKALDKHQILYDTIHKKH